MQGRHGYQPELFSSVDVEKLIPKNHLLRRIDGVLDLGFLQEVTAPLYSRDQGRPSIDPVTFFRMALLQALYNIDSDRQLCEEVGYNLAYRWFCRLSLQDSVPEHSSLTRIRDRLGERTYAQIFMAVLGQCKKAGLVKAEQVMIDGSMIKANASLYSMVERQAEGKSDKSHDDDPPQTSGQSSGQIHSKDGLSNNDLRKQNIQGKKISNATHTSRVDPDATLAGKAHEQKSLQYKTHHTIDGGSRVILDCHVTTGSVSDIAMFQARIEQVESALGVKIGEVVADRGYGSAESLTYLEARGIRSNIPLWSTRSGETFLKELETGFRLSEDGKQVYCPEGHEMRRSTVDRTREIHVLPRVVCMSCPRAATCLSDHEKKTRGKRFSLVLQHRIFLETLAKSKEPEFKKKLWARMWKLEGLFAEGKSHHGLRRARYRGRWKVQAQVYVISAVQNLKRLAAAVILILRSIWDDLNCLPLTATNLQKLGLLA